MSRTCQYLAAVLLAAAGSGSVSATNFNPPSWANSSLTVHVEWDFATEPQVFGGYLPTAFSKTQGSGVGTWSGAANPTVLQTAPEIVWNNGRLINTDTKAHNLSISIANWIDTEELKNIRLQLHHVGAVSAHRLIGFVKTPDGDARTPDGYRTNQGGSQYLSWEDWRIQPNPWRETLTLTMAPGAILYQVVVDTQSVPTPATMLLVGTAGLIASRRRREARSAAE